MLDGIIHSLNCHKRRVWAFMGETGCSKLVYLKRKSSPIKSGHWSAHGQQNVLSENTAAALSCVKAWEPSLAGSLSSTALRGRRTQPWCLTPSNQRGFGFLAFPLSHWDGFLTVRAQHPPGFVPFWSAPSVPGCVILSAALSLPRPPWSTPGPLCPGQPRSWPLLTACSQRPALGPDVGKWRRLGTPLPSRCPPARDILKRWDTSSSFA